MYSQMGNDHGKGSRSGEKKKKKQSGFKESAHRDENSSSPQEIENGDVKQGNEEGERLFLEGRARRKELFTKNFENLKIKSKDPVVEAEPQELGNHNTNLPHNNAVTQDVGSNVDSNCSSPDGLISQKQDGNNPNSSLSDQQNDSPAPPSSAHLSSSGSGRVCDDASAGGTMTINDTMSVNEADSTTDSSPRSIPQGAQNNTQPSGASQTTAGSLSDNGPELSSSDAPEGIQSEIHSNVQPGGLDGLQCKLGSVSDHAPEIAPNSVHTDTTTVHDPGAVSNTVQTGLIPNHAPESDSNRSNVVPLLGDQTTASNSATVVPDAVARHAHEATKPSVKIPTPGDDISQHLDRGDSLDGVPQEQTEYISDPTSRQSIPPTPKSKIESSTPSAMQFVGLRSGFNEKEDAKTLKVDDQLISKTIFDNTLLLEKLSKYLDRESRVIKCWKHLSFVLNVPAEETRNFDIYTEHSPTEDLFNYLADFWYPDLKIKELKVKLKAIYRNDVIDSLNKAGFHDEMNVGDLLFGQPKFIALLSPKLDKESRTIGNWRSLATQFGIRKQKTEQFGLRGSGPTGALFSYMSTTKELRDLTMGELCQHFKAMERRDLVNILEKHNCEDSLLVRKVVVDGSELLADIGERLNKDIRAVKNWRNLAYRLKIPHEVYDAFDTSKGAAKSPTKMLFEWLALWKPDLNVADLLQGLKKIDRNDVVDLVTEEVTVALKNIKKSEADSRCELSHYVDGTTKQSTANQTFTNLQQMHRDADKVHMKTNLLTDLTKNASAKGFVISDNPGQGDCMFFALAEQLEIKGGIKIPHKELRKHLVQFLKDHPKLTDGTDLFNFVVEYLTWTDYLEKMGKDGTWGDHVVLVAAATYFNCVVRVISSLPDHDDIYITPDLPGFDAAQLAELVLGHMHEDHYVSLVPDVSRTACQIPPANRQLQSVYPQGYCGPQGYQQLPRHQQPQGYQQLPRYQQPQGYKQLPRYQQPQGYQELPRYQQPQGYQELQRCQQPQGCYQPQGENKNATKVRQLPFKLYSKICIKLNIRRDWSFDDFRMVAEQLGMDRDTTEYVGQQANPSDVIFVKYCPDVTVHELIDILHKIERIDVAAPLEEWIKEG